MGTGVDDGAADLALDSGLLMTLPTNPTNSARPNRSAITTSGSAPLAGAASAGRGGGTVLICGGVAHAGHALANELICLPHLEHGIRAIGHA